MRYTEMVSYVERVAADGLERQEAERAIAVTLTTLGECLPGDTADGLAAQLPLEAQTSLTEGASGHADLTVREFLRRVADREGVSPSEALDHTRAVMDAVTGAVTGHALQHVRDRLPEDFETLFAPPAAARWPQTHRRRPHP